MIGNLVKVDWRGIVMHKSSTPSAAFIAWLALMGRLNTRKRIKKWRDEVDVLCPFCRRCERLCSIPLQSANLLLKSGDTPQVPA